MKKKITRKPIIIQSTQKNIPIKDIINGIVITKDNRYVKIIEVKPVPFFLKSFSEQASIYDGFSKLLKVCDCDIQIKTVSLTADLSKQLDNLEKDIEKETNENCKQIDDEYRETLLYQERQSVTRRFFVAFSLGSRQFAGKRNKGQEIIQELETISLNIIGYLEGCGNKVITPSKDKADEYLAEIFYTLLNRNKYKTESYEDHLEGVVAKYVDTFGQNKDYVIPVLDCIAPNEISFKDSRFITIDDMYYRYAYISSSGYPKNLSCGWLAILTNTYAGVDVDIYLNKVPKQQVLGNIRRNLTYSIVNASDASQTTEAFDTANNLYYVNSYLKDGLTNGQDFYYANTIVTVCDTDAENVDYKMDQIIKRCKASDIVLKELKFEGELAFKSTLPLGKLDSTLFNKTKRNMLTEGAATFYPFTAFEIMDDDGIYLGNDLNGNSLVVADIFNRENIESSNTFVCGTTGCGKTFTLSLLAGRFRRKHIPTYLIAPEKQDEFKRLTNALGGEFIEIGTSTGAIINIMEIFKPDQKAMKTREFIDGMTRTKSLLDEKVGTVTSFVKLLIETNREQDALLSDAIYETYRRFGITPDNESLWTDKTKTSYKEMPILEDLQKVVGEKMEKEPSLKSIYNTMKYFTSGAGTTFNGQTNINVDNDFIVFGLENLKGETASLGIFLVMDYCLSKIKEDTTKQKALFVDEWWKVAQNPIGAEFTMQMAKLVRALNGALILATQQLSDVFTLDGGRYGQQVIGNCPIRILMKMKENDAVKVQEILLLTDEERDSLVKNERGTALLVYGDNKLNIKFVASETENRLINTDPKFLSKYAEEQRQKIQNEKFAKRVKNAKDLTNLFFTAQTYFDTEDVRLYSNEEFNELNLLKTTSLLELDDLIKELKKYDSNTK